MKFTVIFSQSGSYFEKKKTGDLMTVVNNDTLAIRDLSTELVYTIISDIFVSIALIIYLSYLQLDLLVVVLIIQPIMLVTQRFFNNLNSR
jgi:ABC-type multidrug transport system fused ATPase/permease subunit